MAGLLSIPRRRRRPNREVLRKRAPKLTQAPQLFHQHPLPQSTSSFQHIFTFFRASAYLAPLTLIPRIAAHVEPVHHRHTAPESGNSSTYDQIIKAHGFSELQTIYYPLRPACWGGRKDRVLFHGMLDRVPRYDGKHRKLRMNGYRDEKIFPQTLIKLSTLAASLAALIVLSIPLLPPQCLVEFTQSSGGLGGEAAYLLCAIAVQAAIYSVLGLLATFLHRQLVQKTPSHSSRTD